MSGPSIDDVTASVSSTKACPSDEDLARYLDPDAARGELLRHVDACAGCRGLWLELVAHAPPERRLLMVGRFELRELIGRGAMGDVYAAYDPELEREVAVKLLQVESAGPPGSLPSVLQEAKAMARLSHPNVVAVYDAGRDGEFAYIAMELVRGSTVDQWCASHAPRWAQITKIFLQLGAGLVAAHDAGIIHRDFKPRNALVTVEGVAKVGDFGLAANARAHDDGAELHHVGTPAYMPPEQAAGEAATIQSDQYAFCVALWEALFGARPDAARTAPADHVPARIVRALRRGLRAVPAERFASMSGLLDELRAALAAPARRTRRAVLASTAAIAAALATGTALWARRAATDTAAPCRDAAARLAGAWGAAARDALSTELSQASMPNRDEVRAQVLRALDGYAEAWRDVRTRVCEATHVHHVQSEPLLDKKVACLDDGLAELRALTQILLGGRQLGQDTAAHGALLTRSIDAALALPSPTSCDDARRFEAVPEIAPAERERIATIRALNGTGLYQRAREESAAAAAPIPTGDGATASGLATAATLTLLHGDASAELGRHDDAKAAYQTAARLAARAGDDPLRAEIWLAYAYVVSSALAQPEAALHLIEAAEDAVLRAGDPLDLRAKLESLRGAQQFGADDLGAAIASFRRAIAAAEQAHGPTGITVAPYLNNLGAALRSAGRYDEAITTLRRAVELRQTHLGRHHIDVAVSLMNLGHARLAKGDFAPALELQSEALAIRTAVLGDTHPDVASSLISVGGIQRALGQLEAARGSYRRALEIWTQALGADHPNVALAMSSAATVATQQGQFAEARDLLTASLAIRRARFGGEHTAVANTLQNFGELALAMGTPRDAIAHFTETLRIREAKLGASHPELSYPLLGRGEALLALRRPAAARRELERAWALRQPAPADPIHKARIAVALATAGAPSARALITEASTLIASLVAAHHAEAHALATKIAAWNEVHPE